MAMHSYSKITRNRAFVFEILDRISTKCREKLRSRAGEMMKYPVGDSKVLHLRAFVILAYAIRTTHIQPLNTRNLTYVRGNNFLTKSRFRKLTFTNILLIPQ